MSKTTSTRVLITIDDRGNATLTLNRPDVHNAFDPEMVRALTEALNQVARDKAVRAVVIAGAGKSFCAGADIAHMRQSAHFTKKQNFDGASESARMFHALYSLKKPTVAAVHGAVRGGGCGIVAACDIAIATRSATFRLSEVKIGVIPAMISPYVIGAIGERQSRRYMLSGEEFDATEARRIGLVHEVVEESALDARVNAMLAQLYSSGPNAVQAIKQLIPKSAHSLIGPGIVNTTAKRIAEIRATPEAQEGLSAFLEKRKPSWTEPGQTGGAMPGNKRKRQR
ncbi:MAG: enoyl-CoA hydratase/isomerase family protein [Betaproteobacteria bacterium]|jgi:methylglutaconyl-CoA hydratase|nr:enoyl-CoA hydratase/isomerase family protein [Betaproteobacteria bacterium]MDH5341556.1 enoyl-CoA hydratase/isomerase family protein [Betaproteobacteria bacterium]